LLVSTDSVAVFFDDVTRFFGFCLGVVTPSCCANSFNIVSDIVTLHKDVLASIVESVSKFYIAANLLAFGGILPLFLRFSAIPIGNFKIPLFVPSSITLKRKQLNLSTAN